MILEKWMKGIQKKNPDLIKPEDIHGPFIKRLGRMFSIYLAKFFYKHIPLTPNQITFLVTLISVFIGFLFSLGEYPYTLAAGILLILNLQLDFVDGTLARLQGTASPWGGWIDHISDEFGKIVVYLGIMWGLWRNNPTVWVWVFGYLSLTTYLLGSILYLTYYKLFPFANKIVEAEKSKREFVKQFFYIDPFITVAIAFFAILDQMYLYLIITTFYGALFDLGAFTMMSLKSYRYLKLPIKPKKKNSKVF